jgi:hypothetical protein
VVRGSIAASVVGIAMGIALVVGLRTIVASFVSGIALVNPVAMWLSAVALLGTAVLASFIPAVRATNNRVVTLRQD